MTMRRAMELMMIERACVRKGSGMEWTWVPGKDGYSVWEGYKKVHEECDRDCANCVLVQDSEELLEAYDKVIKIMIEETEKEEIEAEKAKTIELKEWQWNCDPRQDLVI